jgi:translation initiation factor aIF-2/yIF-2
MEQKEEKQERLKSPICCVLGHVDTGKTTFLDKIRNTNVQNKEVGGITQQMGATFFSKDILSNLTKDLIPSEKIKVPGILIMDTPGHEMFSDMRDRGSSMCNIAILIVDITHGLENQTYESIELLRKYKTPFIVALTKIDRIYEWKNGQYTNVKELLDMQTQEADTNLWNRVNEITSQFNNLGLNAELFHLNKKRNECISLIPISSMTGDGFADIFTALIGLTQRFMLNKITYRDNVKCIVLEVRELEGVGKTIDIILVNGTINVGDKIMFLTNNGCETSIIKRIYSPPENKEIRVKTDLISHSSIQASYSAKLFGENLENAITGHRIHVINNMNETEIDELKIDMEKELQDILIAKHDMGIHIQTSSFGSMEALCKYLDDKKIHVSTKGLGTMTKKDTIKLISQLLKSKSKKNHVILAFDVELNKDITKELVNNNIKIFTNKHIYTLISEYEKYREDIKKEELIMVKEKYKNDIQIPVTLKIIPKYVFNKSDPIVVGVTIKKGTLYLHTNLRTMNDKKEFVDIGEVIEIRKDDKEVEEASTNSEVSIKIKTNSNITYGRHFDNKNLLFSKMTKNTVKMLKMVKSEYKIDIDQLNELLTKNNIMT